MTHEPMSLRDVKRIVKKLPWSRIFRIGVQGEPLIYPENFDIMEYMRKLHKMCTITTNGTMLTDDKIVKSIPSNVKVMYISVDAGSPEVYKEYRGWRFDKWKEGVINLRRLRPEIQVQINYLLFKGNLTDVPKMLEFCSEHGLSLSSTFPVIFMEEISRQHDAFWLENLPNIIHHNLKYAKFLGVPYLCSTGRLRWRRCVIPWVQPLIGIQGDVYVDFFIYQLRNYDRNGPVIWREYFRDKYKEVPQHEYIMGNILEDDWRTIWNNSYTPFLLKLDSLNNMKISSKMFSKMYEEYPVKYDQDNPRCSGWEYCKICGRRWGYSY